MFYPALPARYDSGLTSGALRISSTRRGARGSRKGRPMRSSFLRGPRLFSPSSSLLPPSPGASSSIPGSCCAQADAKNVRLGCPRRSRDCAAAVAAAAGAESVALPRALLQACMLVVLKFTSLAEVRSEENERRVGGTTYELWLEFSRGLLWSNSRVLQQVEVGGFGLFSQCAFDPVFAPSLLAL